MDSILKGKMSVQIPDISKTWDVTLRTKAMAVNEEAYELLEMTEAVWLKNHKPKNSNSFLEQYGLRVRARMLAEEMVLQEVVYRFH